MVFGESLDDHQPRVMSPRAIAVIDPASHCPPGACGTVNAYALGSLPAAELLALLAGEGQVTARMTPDKN